MYDRNHGVFTHMTIDPNAIGVSFNFDGIDGADTDQYTDTNDPSQYYHNNEGGDPVYNLVLTLKNFKPDEAPPGDIRNDVDWDEYV